nr:D-alanyl-D-alanine carboxypeptidase/D-alanyl-D-alanine-endopeptidase [Neobacillus bataviensis]
MLKKGMVLLCMVISVSVADKHTVFANENTSSLRSQLNQVLSSEPALQGSMAGISIRSAADRNIIYQYQGDLRLRPASNMKLLTAAAALSVLGENHTFSTEIYAEGPVKKQTLKGNLFLKGKGDPTLLKTDFDKMAEEIQKLGIKKIKGNLIGDDSWYDDVRYSLDLPWSDETAYYGAQVSALTASPTTDYDTGSIKVEIQPGIHRWDKPMVKITPKTDYVKIVNKAITVQEDGRKKLTVEREHATNTITIEGTIPMKAKVEKEWVGVWNPTRYAVTLFQQSLANHGITLTGKIKTGMVPEKARILYIHHSMPLSRLLVPFLKLSNNVLAEGLVKEMGKVVKGEGSWEKGLDVLKTEMTNLGVNPRTMVIRDGSGISHVDLISANQLSLLLWNAQKQKWYSSYLNALPLSGIHDKMVGGSLRNRMKNPDTQGRVRAKTGTISTVSSLSGYVHTKSGKTLIFSILLNNLLDESKGKKIEDRIVSILASQ